MVKDDAYYEAQAKKAAAALAGQRRPRVEAALDALAPTGDLVADLLILRDGMHEGETKNALSSVVSILTSAPVMIRSELATLQAAVDANGGDA